MVLTTVLSALMASVDWAFPMFRSQDMSKPAKISELPKFDIIEVLKTDEDIANYLMMALEEDDANELSYAMRVVARALKQVR